MVSSFAVIIAAAGQSSRFKDKHYKKPFAQLDNRPVWLYSAEAFFARDDVKQVIVVIASEDNEEFYQKFGANVAILGIDVVHGGATRADSVQNALEVVKPEMDYVAVHDAARPCIAGEWIEQVFAAARQNGAAILAVPITATLKRVEKGQIKKTVSRENLWAAQTPQVFQRKLLLDAYSKRGDLQPTDDAQLLEQLGHPVSVVACSEMNVKITTKDDLKLARQLLKVLPKSKLKGPTNPFADGDMWR